MYLYLTADTIPTTTTTTSTTTTSISTRDEEASVLYSLKRPPSSTPTPTIPSTTTQSRSTGSTTGGTEPLIDIDLGIISLQLYLAILNTANQQSFVDWARENNKTYSSADFQRRYKIYVDNLVYVENYVNLNPNSTFQLGMTQFADLTLDEFKHIYASVKNCQVKKDQWLSTIQVEL
eukprot:gene13321-15661_t